MQEFHRIFLVQMVHSVPTFVPEIYTFPVSKNLPNVRLKHGFQLQNLSPFPRAVSRYFHAPNDVFLSKTAHTHLTHKESYLLQIFHVTFNAKHLFHNVKSTIPSPPSFLLGRTVLRFNIPAPKECYQSSLSPSCLISVPSTTGLLFQNMRF